MDMKNVDFATLKRLAPGRFSEDMLAALKTAVNVSGLHLEVGEIELGDDPVAEKLNAVFFVSTEEDRLRNPPSRGAKLFFTFTSEASVKENLEEFEEFVREHAATAATPPSIARSLGHGHGGY
jgi:hypothetical protein